MSEKTIGLAVGFSASQTTTCPAHHDSERRHERSNSHGARRRTTGTDCPAVTTTALQRDRVLWFWRRRNGLADPVLAFFAILAIGIVFAIGFHLIGYAVLAFATEPWIAVIVDGAFRFWHAVLVIAAEPWVAVIIDGAFRFWHAVLVIAVEPWIAVIINGAFRFWHAVLVIAAETWVAVIVDGAFWPALGCVGWYVGRRALRRVTHEAGVGGTLGSWKLALLVNETIPSLEVVFAYTGTVASVSCAG